jgi:hypothetical protein
MAGRPPSPRPGKLVKNSPTGFPLYFDNRKPRIVTADPWAFLSHLAETTLTKARGAVATAYIEQGFEFFEAAQTPRLQSRPLLYYYSFLNLLKASLLIRAIALPPNAKHGISDPRANSRTRLRFEGQTVRVPKRAKDHSELFPEFLNILGYRGVLPRQIKILDLLRWVPSIHRTYARVEKCAPCLLPVLAFEILIHQDQLWARIRVSESDRDVNQVLPELRKRRQFVQVLQQVAAAVDGELWFETRPVAGRKRGVDRAISTLAVDIRALGVASLLTGQQGYRWYLVNATPRQYVPYLAAAYGAMYYLGSITRYKPDVFHKVIAGRHNWVVEEFLATQPMQFLHCLASELAGVDVVRPYAVIH